MASLRDDRRLIAKRLTLLAVLVASGTSRAPCADASPPWLWRSSAGRFPTIAIRRRSSISASNIDGGITDCVSSDKSYALNESDFEDDDDSCSEYYGSDDESILRAATSHVNRGGAAATASRSNLPGLHSGWRKQNRQQERRQVRQSDRRRLRQFKQMQQLENIQQQKMRQLRKAFRRKQQQFQEALYNLNSRLGYDFPRPPYSLWRLAPEPAIGKTTLTGKIFMLNIAMFGLQTAFPQITARGAKRSDMIMEGRQLYRLLTPVFLHGGIGHLMANSYSLKSMGVNVERAFGQPRLFATYLVSGVMGNVLSAIQSPNPAVGASGAIFGLVGAYYTFLSRNQELFGYAGHMQKSALIETIGVNLLLGMTNPMIDNWGHIGGFIGGVGMAYLIGPKLYVARVPLGEDNLAAGGFGAGKVVIDRPTIMFRTPEVVDDGMYWINDNARKLGRRVTAGARGLLNGESEEYFLDKTVDYSLGSAGSGNGDVTIYRTLKGDVELEGNSVNVSPSDGFRQNVSELDPTPAMQRQTRQRRSAPTSGRSIRPRYGHLYR